MVKSISTNISLELQNVTKQVIANLFPRIHGVRAAPVTVLKEKFAD